MADMVTRTKTMTKITVKGINVKTDEVVTYDLSLPGIYRTEKDAMRAVEKKLRKAEKESETPSDIKPLAIVGMETCDVLYGMTLGKFMQEAEILPPRKDYGKKTE